MKINSNNRNFKNKFGTKITLLIAVNVGFFLLGAVGAWAYSWSPAVKWSGTSASYYISTGFSSSENGQLIYGDEEWTINGGSKFAFSYKGTTTRSATSSSGLNDSYSDILRYNSGNTGKLALTTARGASPTITQVDTVFNTYYSFSTSGAAGYYDMRNTMTHEFGHWLFLADLSSTSSPSYCNSSSESTMCGTATTGETRKRSIATDDKNGIVAIYGRK